MQPIPPRATRETAYKQMFASTFADVWICLFQVWEKMQRLLFFFSFKKKTTALVKSREIMKFFGRIYQK